MDKCKDVLIEKNLDLNTQEKWKQIFLLSLIDKESYSKNESKLSTDYGDFDNMNKYYKKQREYYKYNFSSSDAISALSIVGLPGAVDAWKKCMMRNRVTFYGWIDGNPEDVDFTIKIRWDPSRSFSSEMLQNFNVEIFGFDTEIELDSIESSTNSTEYVEVLSAIPNTLDPIAPESSFSIICKRKSKHTTVRGKISGNVIDGDRYDWSFYIPAVPSGLQENPFYLSDYPAMLINSDNIHGGIRFNRVYWQNKIVIKDVTYDKGIGMHSPKSGRGISEFQIPDYSRYFKAIFGMARLDSHPNSFGNGKGEVWIDNNKLWEGSLNGNETINLEIPIPSNSNVLKLVVEPIKHRFGNNWGSHTTWANARFVEDADD